MHMSLHLRYIQTCIPVTFVITCAWYFLFLHLFKPSYCLECSDFIYLNLLPNWFNFEESFRSHTHAHTQMSTYDTGECMSTWRMYFQSRIIFATFQYCILFFSANTSMVAQIWIIWPGSVWRAVPRGWCFSVPWPLPNGQKTYTRKMERERKSDREKATEADGRLLQFLPPPQWSKPHRLANIILYESDLILCPVSFLLRIRFW